MKERPILMNQTSVLALLAKRKTQTRRTIAAPHINEAPYEWAVAHQDGGGNWIFWYPGDTPDLAEFTKKMYPNGEGVKCPYGKPGDRLWVRETWRIDSFWDGEPIVFGYKDGATMEECCEGQDTLNYEDWYERMTVQSTEDCEHAGLVEDREGYYRWEIGNSPCRWRPSIFMPRWASRFTLEVVNVKAERVQDISEADAKAEGVEPIMMDSGGQDPSGRWVEVPDYVTAYSIIWNEINSKPKPVKTKGKVTHYVSYPWESVTERREYRGLPWLVRGNPWIWAIEFRQL